MTRIALFHSVLGVRPGVLAAANVFRDAGHQVEVIDQYDGRVFADYAEASALAESIGYPVLMASALRAVADDPGPLVTAGFSVQRRAAAGDDRRFPVARRDARAIALFGGRPVSR